VRVRGTDRASGLGGAPSGGSSAGTAGGDGGAGLAARAVRSRTVALQERASRETRRAGGRYGSNVMSVTNELMLQVASASVCDVIGWPPITTFLKWTPSMPYWVDFACRLMVRGP